MRNFIRENWFKIGLLLTLVFIGLEISIVFSHNTQDSSGSSLYAKRESCAQNREVAQKQLQDTYKLATPFFYDIFYSPKVDSCIYTYGLILSGTSPNEIGSFVIADYFAGEQIFSIQYDNSSATEADWSTTKRPIFTNEIEKYR